MVMGLSSASVPVVPKLLHGSESPGRFVKTDCWAPPPDNLIQWVWGEVQKSAFPVGSRGTQLLLEGCREDPHFGDHCSARCGFPFTRLSDFSF